MFSYLFKMAALLEQSEVPGIKNISDSTLFDNVLNVFYFLAGLVAVIVIILAGMRYATSSGDAGKVTSAKNQLLFAVIGLIVIAVAFVITNFVVGRFK
jgi:cytochrome bd-type quinol oxidase subunit 2